MSRRGLTFGLAAVFVAVLIVLAAFLPVPYVVLLPGPVTDTLSDVPGTTTPVVSVSGTRTYPTGGHLYMTTVGGVPADCSTHPRLWQAIRAWFDNTQAVEPMQVQCPPGQSDASVRQSNENDMTQSQRDAITAALLQLHYPAVSREFTVGAVSADAPAAKVLQDGDAILAIDGTSVSSLNG